MTINDEIIRIENAKKDIKTAIETNGITVPNDIKLSQFAPYITSIGNKFLPLAGGTMSGPITIGAGDGNGILFKDKTSNINIVDGNTRTLVGFLNGNFTLGYPSYPISIRGSSLTMSGGKATIQSGGAAGFYLQGVSTTTDYAKLGTQDANRVFFIQPGTQGTVTIGGDTTNASVQGDKSAKLIVHGDIKENGTKLLDKYIHDAAAVRGQHINEVGTPSVSVSTTNGTSTFTFDYLKGEQGIVGPQGPQGFRGAQGPQGLRGSKIFVSNTDESANNYQVDDIWLDTRNYDLNRVQFAGDENVWALSGNIKGEKGDIGPQGPAGPTGPRGPAGANGAPGSAGANGYTFTPSVASNGDLTWTKAQGSGGSVPAKVNIKGPKGEPGQNGGQGPVGPAGQDGHSPYIDGQGYWYYWDEQEAVSTGNGWVKDIKAQGPKGDTGSVAGTRNGTEAGNVVTSVTLDTSNKELVYHKGATAVLTSTNQSISGIKTFTQKDVHQAGVTISEGTSAKKANIVFDSTEECLKFVFD